MAMMSLDNRWLDRAGCAALLIAVLAWTVATRGEEPKGRDVGGSAALRAPTIRTEVRDKTAKAKTAPQVSTILQIEIIGTDATVGLESQNWGKTFETLGRSARIRTAQAGETPSVSESTRGTLRTVRVIGELNRKGTVTFPGKSFARSDERELKEWLDELESYGAQGSPAGQPHWGLNAAQAEDLLKKLSPPIESECAGRPLIEIATEIGFGKEVPLRAHTSAEEAWNPKEKPLVAMQEVRGLSRGSGFAALLADHGLCMRPFRTPQGTIELLIQPRQDVADPWPVGWDPGPEVPRSQLMPTVFAQKPIGFLDRPIVEMIEEVRTQTDSVIVVDLWKSTKHGIDLQKSRYEFPKKRTAWILVLKSAIGPTGLLAHFRLDEAGKTFLWLAPFEQPPVKPR
jgi:hypothetical protein